MGTKALFIPISFVVALVGAAFLFNPAPVAAAERDSLARGIMNMVTERLCDRQAALGGRVTLIHPSKCTHTPPPAEPTVTLSASPAIIASGESTILTWSSTDATSCAAFEGWSGTKPTNGTASVSPTVTTTYQLDCTGPGGVGSDDATVTVTVVNPTMPTVDISANPTTISSGSSTTLTWNSENATSCTASNGWSGAKALDGTQVVSPTATATYAISCTGAGGTVEDSVIVTVNQADPEDPTLDLTANPTTVNEGSSSLLSWSTTNASSCQKSGGWSGATTTSGTLSVTPTATTTYSMECTGPGGSITDSVTVTVVLTPEEPSAPTVDLVASPTSVTPGAGSATTTLTWTTANATTCSASGGTYTGSKVLNGTEIITPSATTTYMLECVGGGGTTTDSVVVNFVPTPVEPEPTVNHLLISEVHYNPDTAHGAVGSPDDNEWVEIYNPTSNAVTMNNWWIGDTSTSIDRIPNGTTILAGGYLVISQSSTTPTFWPATTATFLSLEATIGGGLANANDALFLFDASGATTTVDSISWGTNVLAFNPGATSVDDGQSLARSVLTTDTDTATDWSTLASPSFGF